MLISIGVKQVQPYHLATIRAGVAAVSLGLLIVLTRQYIPRDWKTLGLLLLMGIVSNVLPINLLAWGEQTVDSGLTGVLHSTTALFGIIIAHFAFKDEPLTLRKIAGIVLGFVGVVVLASRNWQGGELETSSLAGQIAIIMAAFSAACATVMGRYLLNRNLSPIVIAGMGMLSATLVQSAFLFIGNTLGTVDAAVPIDTTPTAIVAIVVLGFLNTFIAQLLFYEVVRGMGAGRASMITFTFPPVSLFLGVMLLGEVLDGYIIMGTLLILGGIAIVNLKVIRWLNARKPVTAVGGD